MATTLHEWSRFPETHPRSFAVHANPSHALTDWVGDDSPLNPDVLPDGTGIAHGTPGACTTGSRFTLTKGRCAATPSSPYTSRQFQTPTPVEAVPSGVLAVFRGPWQVVKHRVRPLPHSIDAAHERRGEAVGLLSLPSAAEQPRQLYLIRSRGCSAGRLRRNRAR